MWIRHRHTWWIQRHRPTNPWQRDRSHSTSCEEKHKCSKQAADRETGGGRAVWWKGNNLTRFICLPTSRQLLQGILSFLFSAALNHLTANTKSYHIRTDTYVRIRIPYADAATQQIYWISQIPCLLFAIWILVRADFYVLELIRKRLQQSLVACRCCYSTLFGKTSESV